MTDFEALKAKALESEHHQRKYREARHHQLRSDLTEEQKAEALRIGRIEFKSAGAPRKR